MEPWGAGGFCVAADVVLVAVTAVMASMSESRTKQLLSSSCCWSNATAL